MWIFHTSTCAAVVVMRYKFPESKFPRDFRVPLFVPFLICIIGTYLVLVPFIQELQKLANPKSGPFDFGYIFVFAWILLGLAIYIPLKKQKSKNVSKQIKSATRRLQLFFQVVPPE